ncbi:MAG: N-terminal half of MaoC dehydratase [Chloroflexi bacterium]|jgi:acyl dehydratase|nr:MAG: N-terminal half of MaoC dehydratase [Chloroflexota bacterium]
MSEFDSISDSVIKRSIGVESAPITYVVGTSDIIDFTDAVGDFNEIYRERNLAKRRGLNNIVAPPTFLRTLKGSRSENNPEHLGAHLLDGGSEWNYFEPILAGDNITVVDKLLDVLEKTGKLGKMLIWTREFKYTNQHSKVVAIHKWTRITY